MATTSNNPLRVMVDANVLIAGSVWPRFPYAVLQHAVAGDFKLVLSSLVIAETHRRITLSFPDNVWRLTKILTLSNYEEVPNPSKGDVQAQAQLLRDATDIPIALAAIEAQVDFLVTQDRDFTDRDESTKELHRRLNIILPGTFLREYMSWTSEELEAIRKRNWSDLED